jgi:hypothetical protein
MSGEMRKAVHAASGAESCDGQPLELTDEDPRLREEADALEAEFGGLFAISVRFRTWRATWREGGGDLVHYEAPGAELLRPLLRSAVLSALRAEHGEAYLFGYDEPLGWWASRRGQVGDLIAAPMPGELAAAVKADLEARA